MNLLFFQIWPNQKKSLIYLCKICLSVVIENQSQNVIMMWINIICLEKYDDKTWNGFPWRKKKILQTHTTTWQYSFTTNFAILSACSFYWSLRETTLFYFSSGHLLYIWLLVETIHLSDYLPLCPKTNTTVYNFSFFF